MQITTMSAIPPSFDLLHNIMMESGLSGFSCDQDPDEAESRGSRNSYKTPCLSQFQTKVRSNKAQNDHHSRVKDRLRSKIQGKLAEKMKPAEKSGYKTAIPRSLSHTGQAMEAESTLPDLSLMYSPASVKSPEGMIPTPDCQQAMDVEMMSPAEVMPDAVHDPTGQPISADSGPMLFNISELANSVTPGHVTQDQWGQISLPQEYGGSGLSDTSIDPVLANFDNWALVGSADGEEAEIKRLEISLIEEELKTCGEHVQMKENDGTGNDYNPLMFPEEGSFLDNLMSVGVPMQQGGPMETLNQKPKMMEGNGAIYEQCGETEQGLLFDQFGNYAETKPQLPSFNTSFQSPRAHVPAPLPAPSIKVEVRLEGRCYKIPVKNGTKVRAVMDEFQKQANVEDEFFLTDATFITVSPEMTLDNPGTYQFQVTLLPKPAKPPRRRHNKLC